jgi:hypothetical protein
VGGGLALALAVVLWGGYSHAWHWTGINGSTATLWDWLHLLLLPLAVAVVPIWLRHDTQVGSRTKLAGVVLLALFALVAVLGYALPWSWTGFEGNTLWDWLSLVVLPLTVVAAPRMLELRDRWHPRHSLIAGALALVFVAIVLGGYLGSWSWTGFVGNTLWNWLNLLFLPLLLPTLVLPALTPVVTRDVVYLDAEGRPVAHAPAPRAVAAAEPPSSAAGPAAPPAPDASARLRTTTATAMPATTESPSASDARSTSASSSSSDSENA